VHNGHDDAPHNAHDIMGYVNLTATLIGFFLGFVFGVGCALAVMYSIYAGGYRAAVRDAVLPIPPERLLKAREKALSTQLSKGVTKN
jgi:hypothetical protein